MYTKTAPISARSVLGAVAACTLLVGGVAAKDHIVPVSAQVSTRGLDLSQPADAQTFYTRLQNAAWMVCTRGTRADLPPVDDLKGCYEKALGNAVHATSSPMVTRIYLGSHTLQEAAARGIELPPQVAAK
jgi:UrcA family protein